ASSPSASHPRNRLARSYTTLGNLLKESDRQSEADECHRKSLANYDGCFKASAATEALAKSPEQRAGVLYDMACVSSLSWAVATARGGGPFAEMYAARADELLRLAVAKGYKDYKEGGQMLKDSDLDPLRQRADFQKLLKELEGQTTDRP